MNFEIIFQKHKILDKLVKEKPFKLEKDIQNLFEVNLDSIMGLQIVKSEFTIKSKRIDTFKTYSILYILS